MFLSNGTNKIIRHHFIANNYQLYLEKLPKGIYTLYYWIGDGFTNAHYLFNTQIGNFTETIRVDSFAERVNVMALQADSFLFSIPSGKINTVDTLLLKRIFNKK